MYKKYLTSDTWGKKRRGVMYWHGKRCLICDANAVDIHHLTYKRLGNENIKNDCRPLCRKHHFEMHTLAKDTGENLWNTTNREIKKRRQKRRLWKDMTPFEREQYLGKSL